MSLLSHQAGPAALERAPAAQCHGEVTRRFKEALVRGTRIRKGDYLALWGSHLTGVQATFSQAVLSLLQAPPRDDFSRLVLVAGEDCDPDEIETLLLEIGRLHPAARVEFLWGGQPHHPALITLE